MKQFLHVLEECDLDFRKLIRVMCVTKVGSITMLLWQYGECEVTTVYHRLQPTHPCVQAHILSENNEDLTLSKSLKNEAERIS